MAGAAAPSSDLCTRKTDEARADGLGDHPAKTLSCNPCGPYGTTPEAAEQGLSRLSSFGLSAIFQSSCQLMYDRLCTRHAPIRRCEKGDPHYVRTPIHASSLDSLSSMMRSSFEALRAKRVGVPLRAPEGLQNDKSWWSPLPQRNLRKAFRSDCSRMVTSCQAEH